MASGGQKQRNPQSSASEPRQRTSWQRTTSMSDKDDNVSLNSFPNDLRPNNWDFSDWKPTGNKDQTKRRKKGNPEWEREQSLTQDSPPPSERQHGTPRTFPRTKLTPSTPTSQRVALENLRQAMTFSDQEDGISNDGERNNERNLLRRRENLPSYGRQESAGNIETQLSRPVPNQREDRNNRNNNKQNHNEARAAAIGKPDSSQIVGRLMQIRDYIKQANSMMDSLRKSRDPPGYKDEMDRLQKLMDHLKEQERGYTGLLQTLLSVREEPDVNDASHEMTPNTGTLDDTRSVDLDIQSEVSDREERSVSASLRPRIEDNLGLTSDNDDEVEEEGIPSETSDNSSTMDDTVISARKKELDCELGESELAMAGVNNPREAAETLVALRQQQELLQKLIEQQEQMRALRGRQAALLALQQDAESKLATTRQKSNEARSVSNSLEEAAISMTNRVDSLSRASGTTGSNASRQQQADPELLDIRQQLQYLRNELKSQDQKTHPQAVTGHNLQSNRLKDVRPKNQPPPRPQLPPRPPSPKFFDSQTNETEAQLVRDMVPPTEMSKDQLQERLNDLLGKKDKLDKLIQEEFSNPMLPMPTAQMNHDELQTKLRELQGKKKRMDSMLQELHSLRNNPAFLLNNAISEAGTKSVPSTEIDPVGASSEGTDNLANGVLEMLDARQKMQKLNEVKERLSQLKSLVHMYESTEGAAGNLELLGKDDETSVPAYTDYGAETEVSRDRVPERDQKQAKAAVKPQINIPVRPQQQAPEDSDENSSSSSSSSSSSTSSGNETESQLSSLGPWGDDPEIQEKVHKLKEAKEKLKHLQNLVAIVQHSPGMADELPDNLAEIAASVEDVESQLNQTDDRNNASEGEAPTQAERDAYYQTKMEEQMNELEELKNEKSRLLAIQSQLQSLHDKFSQEEAGRLTVGGQDTRGGTTHKSPVEPDVQQQMNGQQQSAGPSVTFSSNDEVYYKMRNQRMLREELRDKKKQLESIMKKDRNKKQYYKNQDNQSDTVSYSTEMFGIGASVDQTMATWGGSTVDNLESITEDGAVQDNDDEEDDDAYPIDGILQVEEEEEENQSDNETYTIEDDVRQRRKARAMAKSGSPDTNTQKGKRSFPRPSRQADTRPKEAWTGQPDFNKWSRKGRKNRQENYRSAEEIVQEDEEPENKSAIEELQRKLEETSMLCQSLLGENQSGPLLGRQTAAGFGSHGQLDLHQQLQQQQLMMSLNQCYQQISMQQMEMQNMQRQMQALVYQLAEGDINESGFSSDLKVRSLPSLYSPMMPRQSPSVFLPPGADAFQFNPVYQHMSPANNRLLRHAADPESGNRSDVAEGQDRQRRSSRQSGRDSYSQRSKKKSVSPQQMSNVATRRAKTTSVQTYPELEEEEEEAVIFSPDRETFEDYLSRKRREFLERNNLQDRSQRQTLDTGTKRVGKSKFVNNGRDLYRPGLSAGISGAGYAEDVQSITSSIQSNVAAVSQVNQTDMKESTRDTEDPMEMSLFETLRENIYSEVATLISQNENRPHYLIELFRELQLLTTDYLRQRVLYDIKDVVSKYLVEENSVSAPPPPWLNTVSGNFTNTELTPSESNVTTDDEEIKYLLQTKLKQKVAANLVAKERQKTSQLIRTGSLKNDKYDYQEPAEIDSSVSTPSNSFWDNPFNSDSLGETVINLDKTLEKMKEYEKRLAAKNEKVKRADKTKRAPDTNEVSSSAMDQGDESSVNSDSVPYPRIDTQQLDQQIKSIMTEVIPVIKEHMDNMCSPQLLAYIKRLVLSLTRQYDSGEEFARFFHRQLGSILQDTLAKYEGRKMRECGEDLLVDMSEVLFNELAFFRLMQDLDDPLIAEKMKKADAISDYEEDTGRDLDKEENENGKDESEDESDTTETTANASDNQDDTRPTQTEEEDLGKARDDELANEVEVQDADEKDEDPESPFKGVQIELAPSETKPYTRIGSDEDDESADDESQSNEDDPSETAVSINARRITDSVYTDDNEDDAIREDGSIEGGATTEDMVPVSQLGQDQGKDADQGASSGKMETEYLNGDISPVEATEHMNGDILNGDIEVITMDDLPASLTVMSSEDLQQKLNEEQQNNSGAAAVLGTLDTSQELVGDPQFLKEPDEASG